MPISIKSRKKANSLLEAISIGEKIVKSSKHLDSRTKLAFNKLHQYTARIIENGFKNNKLTAYELRTIESEIFTYWNESINLDVERFWKEVQNKNLEFHRKNMIKFLLEKGRLKDVEQWIGLYKCIEELHSTNQITLIFKKNELNQIQELIDKEVEKRQNLVRRCLEKGSISLSQYIKFGESITFLERCNLTPNYFSQDERNQIFNM